MGAFGFLAGPKDKKTGEEVKGNFGILDQMLALQWVKENIKAFGGDPDKVTIQGESAGAMSVGLHLLSSPGSRGLFNSAIMESNPLGIPYRELKQEDPIARKFAEKLGCPYDDVSCMRYKTSEEVLEAQGLDSPTVLLSRLLIHGIRDLSTWAPVIDGEVIISQPIKQVSKTKIAQPLIVGTNKQEGALFIARSKIKLGLSKISDTDYKLMLDFIFRDDKVVKKVYEKYPPNGNDNTLTASKVITDWLFTCPSLYLAKESSPRTWVYEFSHIPSFNIWQIEDITLCRHAVCHAVEIPFVFHTAKNIGYSFTEEEKQLSRLMINYWTNFSKQSNPNGKGPPWPEFRSTSKNVILVTPIDEIEDEDDLNAHCEFWNEIGYDLDYSLWDLF